MVYHTAIGTWLKHVDIAEMGPKWSVVNFYFESGLPLYIVSCQLQVTHTIHCMTWHGMQL